jgi:peptide/nickel transport system ATP-binding protein
MQSECEGRKTVADTAAAAPASERNHGSAPLLSVEDLRVAFKIDGHWLDVIHDVSFEVGHGETLALVGESGSGKTVSAAAVLGLMPLLGGRITGGRITYDGIDLLGLSKTMMGRLRGSDIGMIFQQPTRSLNPAFTVGHQIAETARLHLRVSPSEAWDRAVEALARVHIQRAAERAKEYPHMFSGGMCQRVMIAMALVCEPRLLIADEPTTALDVTVQRRFLDVLQEIKDTMGLSVLYITHDLGVVAEVCDRVAVMYAGEIIECGTVADIFLDPQHPYTDGLLASIPRRGETKRMHAIPGVVPSPADRPAGCAFHPRCAFVEKGRCTTARVDLELRGAGRPVRCVRADELDLEGLRR